MIPSGPRTLGGTSFRQVVKAGKCGYRMAILFSSNANADFEGLLDAKRGIRMPQAAEKTVPAAPPNLAVRP